MIERIQNQASTIPRPPGPGVPPAPPRPGPPSVPTPQPPSADPIAVQCVYFPKTGVGTPAPPDAPPLSRESFGSMWKVCATAPAVFRKACPRGFRSMGIPDAATTPDAPTSSGWLLCWPLATGTRVLPPPSPVLPGMRVAAPRAPYSAAARAGRRLARTMALPGMPRANKVVVVTTSAVADGYGPCVGRCYRENGCTFAVVGGRGTVTCPSDAALAAANRCIGGCLRAELGHGRSTPTPAVKTLLKNPSPVRKIVHAVFGQPIP